jgi:hypothetical protein
MSQQVTNFARFYGILKEMPGIFDREEFKRSLVQRYSDGRTDSLRELTSAEYKTMCDDLQKEFTDRSVLRDELRRHRSECLMLMQRLGIDTTDWARVDRFCADARIVGKAFREITVEELEELAVKLRTITRKGGLKSTARATSTPEITLYPLFPKASLN